MTSFVAKMSSQVARGHWRINMPSEVLTKAIRSFELERSGPFGGELNPVIGFDGGGWGAVHGSDRDGVSRGTLKVVKNRAWVEGCQC